MHNSELGALPPVLHFIGGVCIPHIPTSISGKKNAYNLHQVVIEPIRVFQSRLNQFFFFFFFFKVETLV